jgi:putative ABC transport system ATP-binding protein
MIVQLENVCKDYYQGKEPVHVLHDISMSVEQGEYIAIMGPSGSGKTTLMNVLGCLDVPTSGTYMLEGQDIGSMSDDALADVRNQSIGFVFQNFHLLPKMTALDNVALPLLYRGVSLKDRRTRAEAALKLMGLGERMDFYPNQLSGGQQQRVAIARAIVGNPKLLLADEPTGALDTASGVQIMDIFRRLSQRGITIIMITHELGIAQCADKIYHILDGRLHTNGVPQYTPKEEAHEEE